MRELYYQNKSANYGIGNTRRKKILDLLENKKNKKVLDIGCSTGYLGAEIRNLGNYVEGVEISETASEKAREKLDKVYNFDVEKEWPEEIKNKKFSIVILAEVLEHVFDPPEILKKISDILESDGEIIVTTPNFMTWANRIKFLLGKFQYTDQGALDFGHIRFFTYKYLKVVLRESGFRLAEENHIIFPGKLTKVLKLWPSFFATQFVVKARKI